MSAGYVGLLSAECTSSDVPDVFGARGEDLCEVFRRGVPFLRYV
jgi:hypothetical protein